LLLNFFNKKKTAANSHRKLVKTYGESSLSIKMCETDLNGSEVMILMSVIKNA